MPLPLKNEPRVFAESFSSCTMSLSDTPCWYSTSAGAVLVALIFSPKHRHKAMPLVPPDYKLATYSSGNGACALNRASFRRLNALRAGSDGERA